MWLLLIPPAALLLALLWTAVRGRPKRAREAMITIEGYRRSMDALSRPTRPVRPSVGGRAKDGGGAPERGAHPAEAPTPDARSAEAADTHAVYPGDARYPDDGQSHGTAPGDEPERRGNDALAGRPAEPAQATTKPAQATTAVPAARAVEGPTPRDPGDAQRSRPSAPAEAGGSREDETPRPVG